MGHTHFKGKEAIGHVAETQAEGTLSSIEIHGTETPGHINAGADAAREMALLLLLLGVIFTQLALSIEQMIVIMIGSSIGWILWKIGRSAWLGWQRLERLHRVVAEEKWEIEHHREQERDELIALYGAKGFEGKLLDDVVDVLMADNDRLLRVMIEEELNLSLENQVHPLKQGVGAGIGACLGAFFTLASFVFFGTGGMLAAGLSVIGIAAITTAHWEKNRRVPAAVWTLGLAIVSLGTVYFILEYVV